MRFANTHPGKLAALLIAYYGVIIGILVILISLYPGAVENLPLGGTENLNLPGSFAQRLTSDSETALGASEILNLPEKKRVGIALAANLAGTVLMMIPVAWVYMAMRQDIGYRRNFVRALVALPICTATMALLIQDSLPLAFGSAALVAAVRFRIRLNDTLDGVFIFAAIAVGLSTGIGYAGVAMVMTMFFCFINVTMWALGFGDNPHEEQKKAVKKAARAKAS